MRKLFSILFTIAAAATAQAQFINNAGMEDWRSTTAICLSPFSATPIQAPRLWFGIDSLALSLGPLALGTSGDPFNRQIFRETTLVRTGTASAKLMTAMEGDLGFFPGALTNAEVVVDEGASTPEEMIKFEGGQTVTEQPTSVSAWVVYKPGIDPVTDTTGYDEALLSAVAIATIDGVDSNVGAGFVTITPSDTDTFSQVTATLTYTTTLYPVHTLQIVFASSADPSSALDSSTLYIDDMSMTAVPNPPPPTSSVKAVAGAPVVSFFPNPAMDVLEVTSSAGQGAHVRIIATDGRVMRDIPLTGRDRIDVSGYPAGAYLYTVSDASGRSLQNGRLSITH